MSFRVPSMNLFRNVVNSIDDERNRTLIKTQYLLAARVSEIITQASDYDIQKEKTKPRGQLQSWKIEKYRDETILLIRSPVAKRKVKSKKARDKNVYKIVAIPCRIKYEPWALDLLKYIRKNGKLIFNIHRTRVWQIVKNELSILSPNITDHDLRGIRITHLKRYYDFTPYDITAYAGWTIRTGFGKFAQSEAIGKIDYYLELAWQDYIHKLMRPLDDVIKETIIGEEMDRDFKKYE